MSLMGVITSIICVAALGVVVVIVVSFGRQLWREWKG